MRRWTSWRPVDLFLASPSAPGPRPFQGASFPGYLDWPLAGQKIERIALLVFSALML